MRGNATREELAKFLLDESGHVSAILLLAREECLQMTRQNLVQHGLFGVAWAIALGPANPRARYIRNPRTFHGKAAPAGPLPLPGPFWSGACGCRLSKIAENTTIFSAVSTTSLTIANRVGQRPPRCSIRRSRRFGEAVVESHNGLLFHSAGKGAGVTCRYQFRTSACGAAQFGNGGVLGRSGLPQRTRPHWRSSHE